MNFLEKLFYGNIRPIDKTVEKDSHYAKTLNILAKNEETLSLTLEGKEKKQFTEFVEAQSELVEITALERFIEGFRLGARLMLDTLGSDSNNV